MNNQVFKLVDEMREIPKLMKELTGRDYVNLEYHPEAVAVIAYLIGRLDEKEGRRYYLGTEIYKPEPYGEDNDYDENGDRFDKR